jgi:hypothetical protein
MRWFSNKPGISARKTARKNLLPAGKWIREAGLTAGF